MRKQLELDANGPLKRFADEPVLRADLVRLLLETTPAMLDLARAALERADAAELRYAAHMLKGSASVFEASKCHEAAARLEQLAAAGDLVQAGPAQAAMAAEFETLMGILRPLDRRGV